MNYIAEVNKSRKLLGEGNYCLCSVQCGRITEEVLKDLFKIFLPKAEIQEFEVVKKQLALCKKRSIEYLTLGELCNIYEKTNAFHKLAEHFSTDKKELNLIDLRKMVMIRNKAQHSGHEDREEDTGADAHIIYGCVLKLLKCFGFIDKMQTSITPPPGPKKPPKPPKPELPAETTLINFELINVCRNKASRKYFIYVQDSGSDKMLLITPDCNVRRLERSLFGEIEEKDERELLSKGLISEEQVMKAHEYNKNITIKEPKPIEGSVYTYKIHGAVAKMIVKNKSYVILKDSTAIKDEKKSCPISVLRIKKSLIATGKLVLNPINHLYVFTEDVGFKSPSAASTVISGTSTNGWLCFGIKKS